MVNASSPESANPHHRAILELSKQYRVTAKRLWIMRQQPEQRAARERNDRLIAGPSSSPPGDVARAGGAARAESSRQGRPRAAIYTTGPAMPQGRVNQRGRMSAPAQANATW